MTLFVNEKPYQVEEGTTLAAFMERIGIKPRGIAVAIAYEVIPREKWDTFQLADQMELMLIHAVSGG